MNEAVTKAEGPTRFRVTLVLEDRANDEGALIGFAHGIKIQDADTGEPIDNPDELIDTPALHGLMAAVKTFYALHEKGKLQEENKKRKVIVPEAGVREHSAGALRLLDRGKPRKKRGK